MGPHWIYTIPTGFVFLKLWIDNAYRSTYARDENCICSFGRKFSRKSDHLQDLIENGRIILKRIMPRSSKLVPVHAVKAYGEVDT